MVADNIKPYTEGKKNFRKHAVFIHFVATSWRRVHLNHHYLLWTRRKISQTDKPLPAVGAPRKREREREREREGRRGLICYRFHTRYAVLFIKKKRRKKRCKILFCCLIPSWFSSQLYTLSLNTLVSSLGYRGRFWFLVRSNWQVNCGHLNKGQVRFPRYASPHKQIRGGICV